MEKNKLRFLALFLLSLALIFTACGGGGGSDGSTTTTTPTPTGTDAITDTSGTARSRFAHGDSVIYQASGYAVKTQYDITLLDGNGAEVSSLRLTTDADGNIPPTIMAYDMDAGSYSFRVEQVTRAKVANEYQDTKTFKAAGNFTVSAAATDRIVYACDSTGARTTTFEPGADVYARGSGFTSGSTVSIYVVRDKISWTAGDDLQDISGPEFVGDPETVTVAADGTIPVTKVWAGALLIGEPPAPIRGTTKAGATIESLDGYDIVVDVNRNGKFDPVDGSGNVQDVAKDHLPSAFMIQTSATSRATNDFTAQLACDLNRVYKDSFTIAENVYVYINPRTRMQLGSDRYVNKYVVNHKDTWTTGDALIDVSGPNNPWERDTVQRGCTNEARVLVWPATLTEGRYDVIIDVNRNGKYDAGIDILDGGSSGPGFTVVPPPTPKKRTVMVYINGDNNLDSYAITDINEMKAGGGSNNDVNVVVQLDRAANATWSTARRYYITSNVDLATGYLADLGELNSGDPETLIQFVSWAKTNYPATNYALVLWNHGAGLRAEELGEERPTLFRSISYDDTSEGANISMEGLRHAMSRIKGILGRNVNVLGMDACLMAMAEVAYQVKEYADFLVFSEDLVPGNGWDYTTWLRRVLQDPNISSSSLASYGVTDFMAYYPSTQKITMSAMDTTKVNALATAANTFAQKMIDKMNTGNYRTFIQTQLSNTQVFNSTYNDFKDLYHFADLIATNMPTGITGVPSGDWNDIVTAANALKTAITNAIIAEGHRTSANANAHGLTVWLPDRTKLITYYTKYNGNIFSRDTKWDEFLNALWLGGYIYKIQLTWGQYPEDMDSHLWDSQGNHVYYAYKSITGANLDVDDVTSYGPEHITITSFNTAGSSPYTYAVYTYYGSRWTPSAPVVVKVWGPGSTVPIYTWSRSDFSQTNRWWTVFTINPTTQAITPVNTMGIASPTRMIDIDRGMPIKENRP